MVENWFRSKPKSASAERCLRSLGAMKPIAASEMELSNRSIVCVTGVLSHCGLRKANGKMGVVTGIRSLPGIAAYGTTPGSRQGSAKTRFVEAYTQRFGEKPPKPYIDNCYDAIAVLALAMHQAKSSDPKAIRDALRQVANPPGEPCEPGAFQPAFELISQGKKVNYRGASGEVDFDGHGDVVTPIEVWKIEDHGMIVTEWLEDV